MEEPKKKKKKSKKSDKSKLNDSEVQIKVEDEVVEVKEGGLNNNDTHKKSGKRKSKQLECPVAAKKMKMEVSDKIKDEPDFVDRAEEDVSELPEGWECADVNGLFDFDEDLSSDDEVYCLKLSKKLDPHSLIGFKLAFKERSLLNVDGETIEVNFDANNAPKMNLFAKKSDGLDMRIVQTSGSFMLDQKYEEEDVKNFVSKLKENMITEFPSGLIKQRHSLIGVKYEEKINLDKDVASKLDASRAVVPKPSKKKSKKKKKACNEEIFNILSHHKS